MFVPTAFDTWLPCWYPRLLQLDGSLIDSSIKAWRVMVYRIGYPPPPKYDPFALLLRRSPPRPMKVSVLRPPSVLFSRTPPKKHRSKGRACFHLPLLHLRLSRVFPLPPADILFQMPHKTNGVSFFNPSAENSPASSPPTRPQQIDPLDQLRNCTISEWPDGFFFDEIGPGRGVIHSVGCLPGEMSFSSESGRRLDPNMGKPVVVLSVVI